MGLLIYPMFRTPVPKMKPLTTGEFLADSFATLDEIATDYSLPPFTSFSDRREIPPGFDGPPWELDEILGTCNDWFSVREGRLAFAGLARLIRTEPEAANRLEAPREVADELENLARLLAVAESFGTEFRLAIS